MRRDGIWHPRLAAIVTGMGHGDEIVVADPGLPVPTGVETIDLVFARNGPRFLPVLAVLASELVIEGAVVARELSDSEIRDGLDRFLPDVPIERMSHSSLKGRTRGARAVVRTGEATPYANVILRAGVPF
ncbi:D-ribose pyranase [Terrabacter terrae]